jgi:Ca2+-binding EF-hand superfamily protein
MRSTESLRDELEEIFERVDEDGDGIVSFTEFKGLMLEVGDLSDEAALRTSFGRIDTDRNGRINFDELRAWLKASGRNA